MSSQCLHCLKSIVSYAIDCFGCNKTIHFMCLYDAKCIDSQLSHNNKTKSAPNYAKAIFNSNNFIFVCNICQPSFKSRIEISIVPIATPHQLSNISNKLENIEKLITHSLYNTKSYADSVRSIKNISDKFDKSVYINEKVRPIGILAYLIPLMFLLT